MNDNYRGENSAILDEAIAEFLRAEAAGRVGDVQQWFERYPDCATALAEFFADRQGVDGLIAPVRQDIKPSSRRRLGRAAWHAPSGQLPPTRWNLLPKLGAQPRRCRSVRGLCVQKPANRDSGSIKYRRFRPPQDTGPSRSTPREAWVKSGWPRTSISDEGRAQKAATGTLRGKSAVRHRSRRSRASLSIPTSCRCTMLAPTRPASRFTS